MTRNYTWISASMCTIDIGFMGGWLRRRRGFCKLIWYILGSKTGIFAGRGLIWCVWVRKFAVVLQFGLMIFSRVCDFSNLLTYTIVWYIFHLYSYLDDTFLNPQSTNHNTKAKSIFDTLIKRWIKEVQSLIKCGDDEQKRNFQLQNVKL